MGQETPSTVTDCHRLNRTPTRLVSCPQRTSGLCDGKSRLRVRTVPPGQTTDKGARSHGSDVRRAAPPGRSCYTPVPLGLHSRAAPFHRNLAGNVRFGYTRFRRRGECVHRGVMAHRTARCRGSPRGTDSVLEGQGGLLTSMSLSRRLRAARGASGARRIPSGEGRHGRAPHYRAAYRDRRHGCLR